MQKVGMDPHRVIVRNQVNTGSRRKEKTKTTGKIVTPTPVPHL